MSHRDTTMFADMRDPVLRAWYQETIMPKRDPNGDVRTNGTPTTSGSGKWSRYESKRTTGGFRWAEVDSAAIGECVQAVTNAGDAILFGAASGGGAGVITVCSGEKRIKFYASTAEEMAMHLADIENAAAELSGG